MNAILGEAQNAKFIAIVLVISLSYIASVPANLLITTGTEELTKIVKNKKKTSMSATLSLVSLLSAPDCYLNGKTSESLAKLSTFNRDERTNIVRVASKSYR
uniref:Uncharacterized protein n=1 Tax=Glossina pallidipes TaxID=7398 RepID=A0A1A9ZJ93_GLOPL